MVAYRDDLDGITAAQLSGGFFGGWPNPPTPEARAMPWRRRSVDPL